MIGAYASLLLLVAGSALVGQALLTLAGGGQLRRPSPLGPAVGLVTLLVLAGAAVRLPGEGVTAAIAIGTALLVSAGYLRGRLEGLGAALALAAPVVAITTLAASVPFAVAGQVGVLGAGLVNDDMAAHLTIADWVRDPAVEPPTFVRGGYPIGPHALVVVLATVLGTGLIEAFAGFTLALAPITGMLALGLLGELPRVRRVIAASLVALPYLGAAYLSTGAFKEPLQALILIAFAVLLARLVAMPGIDDRPAALHTRHPRRAKAEELAVVSGAAGGVEPAAHARTRSAPEGRAERRTWREVFLLAALAAASVFNYSLPGLLWITAVAVALLTARWFVVRPRPELPAGWQRQAAPYLIGAVAIVALVTVQEWGRIADFTRISALNPDRFGSDLGNLRQALSPLQALGIWPSGEYRITPANATLPAIAFYAGAALAAAALAVGIARAARERRWTLPALLAAIALVWTVSALFSTPYIAAKALAIAAPVAIALALRGTLAPGAGKPALALGLAFALAATLSSFLALRQAPVRPEAHSPDLAQVREAVQGEEVLFLGRDNFIRWELRGSGSITGVVTNHYDVEEVRGRFRRGRGGGEKFDFDSVFPATLQRFRYVLETAGGPRSTPPPRFRSAVETPSYTLWERLGRVGKRRTLDEGTEPGAVLDCGTPAGRQIASGRGSAQVWGERPVVSDEDRWGPSPDPDHRQPAEQTLELAPGRWLISLAYDSRRSLRVRAPEAGLDEELPANLDFRGPTPTFPIGEIELDRRAEISVSVEVAAPNALARLLGAPNEAHLRELTATPIDMVERIPVREACGEYVDWYRER